MSCDGMAHIWTLFLVGLGALRQPRRRAKRQATEKRPVWHDGMDGKVSLTFALTPALSPWRGRNQIMNAVYRLTVLRSPLPKIQEQ